MVRHICLKNTVNISLFYMDTQQTKYNNQKFTNIYISSSVCFFKNNILNNYKNLKYKYIRNEPCIFFGVYSHKDIKIIKQHKSSGMIILAGSDAQNKNISQKIRNAQIENIIGKFDGKCSERAASEILEIIK